MAKPPPRKKIKKPSTTTTHITSTTMSKTTTATATATATKIKIKTPKTTTVIGKIIFAIRYLSQPGMNTKGSSRSSIIKYIKSEFNNYDNLNALKKAFKKGVSDQVLVQTGQSFRVAVDPIIENTNDNEEEQLVIQDLSSGQGGGGGGGSSTVKTEQEVPTASSRSSTIDAICVKEEEELYSTIIDNTLAWGDGTTTGRVACVDQEVKKEEEDDDEATVPDIKNYVNNSICCVKKEEGEDADADADAVEKDADEENDKENDDNDNMLARHGDTVTVAYTGALDDGYTFGSANEFTFVLGAGDVIKGWDKGVLNMRMGVRRKLIVPSRLGYGKRGCKPDIPSNATLTYIITLKGICNAKIIKRLCPLEWECSDGWSNFLGQVMNQEATLSLDVIDPEIDSNEKYRPKQNESNNPCQGDLNEKCMKYIDPNRMPDWTQGHMENNYYKEDKETGKGGSRYNSDAAKKELAKEGYINNVFDFVAGKEGDHPFPLWEVDTQHRKKLTTAKAIEIMKDLFEGKLCIHDYENENFESPLTSEEQMTDKEKEKESPELSKLKLYIPKLVHMSKNFIEHSYWYGINEIDDGEGGGLVYADREDWFFFYIVDEPRDFFYSLYRPHDQKPYWKIDQKFVLKFKWHHEIRG